jgi:hypothetical protein
MAFLRALEILIDETSYLDLKQNCLIEKTTFGRGAPEERCASERRGDREEVRTDQLAAAQRLCTGDLTVPN